MELIVSKRVTPMSSSTRSYLLSKLYGNFEGSFRNDNTQSDPEHQLDCSISPTPTAGWDTNPCPAFCQTIAGTS